MLKRNLLIKLLVFLPSSSLVIKSESEEEARFVQNILHWLGLRWRGGQSLKGFMPSAYSNKVYHIHPPTATVTYSDADWYAIGGGRFDELSNGKSFFRMVKEWMSENQE